MKTQEARELGERIAAQVRAGEIVQAYDLELEEANDYRIWAYRKAAWTVDEWPESIADFYGTRGEGGLRELPGIGKSLAGDIARWLQEMECVARTS